MVNLAVTDTKQGTIELRALMSANSAGQAFDLRCEVREKMIEFLQNEHPTALPVQRAITEISRADLTPMQAAREAKREAQSVRPLGVSSPSRLWRGTARASGCGNCRR